MSAFTRLRMRLGCDPHRSQGTMGNRMASAKAAISSSAA